MVALIHIASMIIHDESCKLCKSTIYIHMDLHNIASIIYHFVIINSKFSDYLLQLKEEKRFFCVSGTNHHHCKRVPTIYILFLVTSGTESTASL
jgi:hypothetical protein